MASSAVEPGPCAGTEAGAREGEDGDRDVPAALALTCKVEGDVQNDPQIDNPSEQLQHSSATSAPAACLPLQQQKSQQLQQLPGPEQQGEQQEEIGISKGASRPPVQPQQQAQQQFRLSRAQGAEAGEVGPPAHGGDAHHGRNPATNSCSVQGSAWVASHSASRKTEGPSSTATAVDSQAALGGSGHCRVRAREGRGTISSSAGKKRRQVQLLNFDESVKASRVQQSFPSRGLPSPAIASGLQTNVASLSMASSVAEGQNAQAGSGQQGNKGEHQQQQQPQQQQQQQQAQQQPQQQQQGGPGAGPTASGQAQARVSESLGRVGADGSGTAAAGVVASLHRGSSRMMRGGARQENQSNCREQQWERDNSSQRGEGSGSGRGRYSPAGLPHANDGSGSGSGGGAAAGDEEGGNKGGRWPGQSRVSAHRRPSVKRPVAPVAHHVDCSLERLQREATSKKIWQSAEEKELQPIPDCFESVDSYVGSFEPLLFEECRAQLHSEWEELCENSGRDGHLPVRVAVVDQREKGWYEVVLNLRETQGKLTFKDNDVAVLSTPKPGPVNRRKGRKGVWQRDPEDVEEGEICARTVGLVRRYQGLNGRETEGISFRFHVPSDEYESTSTLSPGHVLRELKSRGGDWWLTTLSGLTTIQREYNSLHVFRNFNPQMRAAILKPRPELFPKYAEEEPPALPECFTPAFTSHLHNTFNKPQLSAIQWAAAHTAAGGPSRVNSKGGGVGGSETGAMGNGGACQEPWPFTLVQGPPGTGKTHTVWGMLNVIHLVHFQRYYQSLLRKLAPQAVATNAEVGTRYGGSGKGGDRDEEDGCDSEVPAGIDELLEKMDSNLYRLLPKLCPKPRMLVCAPSNAATDELLARVLERGFIDGEMQQYKPDIARVGMDAQSKAAQAVSVERRTENLLTMKPDHCKAWIQELQRKEHAQAQRISELKNDLREIAAAMKSQGAVGVDPEVLVSRDQEKDSLLQRLAEIHEQRDKVLVELSRLLIVESRLRPGGGMGQEEARAKLEASFAREAEIVFTTVSSSGRRLFARLPHGFDTVVIDEAAQASEMAILPPLSLRCSRCVLVGDPQQLPATVISRVAQTMRYSRSLFERFQQAKCPTILLRLQYRMHPEIRDFPSRYFYEGKLVDAPSVTEMPDEPFHEIKFLSPYVFFDVSKGRESHGGSVSYQNKDEAEFAARLYKFLQRHVSEPVFQKLTIGVITPYKQQLKCLQREFDSILSEKGQIYINTVDAFQGQERDIIIMSCVRASSRGVGFVADIRRMNVALTRARRSLWVLGNGNALSQSEDWSSLIQDAKARNRYIQAPSVHALFMDSAPLPLPLSGVGKPGHGQPEGPPGFMVPGGGKRESPEIGGGEMAVSRFGVQSGLVPQDAGMGMDGAPRYMPSAAMKRESTGGVQWGGPPRSAPGLWANGNPSCGGMPWNRENSGEGFVQWCGPRGGWGNQGLPEGGDGGGMMQRSLAAASHALKGLGRSPSHDGSKGLQSWPAGGTGSPRLMERMEGGGGFNGVAGSVSGGANSQDLQQAIVRAQISQGSDDTIPQRGRAPATSFPVEAPGGPSKENLLTASRCAPLETDVGRPPNATQGAAEDGAYGRGPSIGNHQVNSQAGDGSSIDVMGEGVTGAGGIKEGTASALGREAGREIADGSTGQRGNLAKPSGVCSNPDNNKALSATDVTVTSDLSKDSNQPLPLQSTRRGNSGTEGVGLCVDGENRSAGHSTANFSGEVVVVDRVDSGPVLPRPEILASVKPSEGITDLGQNVVAGTPRGWKEGLLGPEGVMDRRRKSSPGLRSLSGELKGFHGTAAELRARGGVRKGAEGMDFSVTREEGGGPCADDAPAAAGVLQPAAEVMTPAVSPTEQKGGKAQHDSVGGAGTGAADRSACFAGTRRTEVLQPGTVFDAVHLSVEENKGEGGKEALKNRGGDLNLEEGKGMDVVDSDQAGNEESGSRSQRGFAFDLNLTAEENMMMEGDGVGGEKAVRAAQRQAQDSVEDRAMGNASEGAGGREGGQENKSSVSWVRQAEVARGPFAVGEEAFGSTNPTCASLTVRTGLPLETAASDGRLLLRVAEESGARSAVDTEQVEDGSAGKEGQKSLWERRGGGRIEVGGRGRGRKRVRQSFLDDSKDEDDNSRKVSILRAIGVDQSDQVSKEEWGKRPMAVGLVAEGRCNDEAAATPPATEAGSRVGESRGRGSAFTPTEGRGRGRERVRGRGSAMAGKEVGNTVESTRENDNRVWQALERRNDNGIREWDERAVESKEVVRPETTSGRVLAAQVPVSCDGRYDAEERRPVPFVDMRGGGPIAAGPRPTSRGGLVAGLVGGNRDWLDRSERIGSARGIDGGETENELEELKEEDWRHIRMAHTPHSRMHGPHLASENSFAWSKGKAEAFGGEGSSMDPRSSVIVENPEQQRGGRIWNDVRMAAGVGGRPVAGPVGNCWGKEWDDVRVRDLWRNDAVGQGSRPMGMWREDWGGAGEGSAGLQSFAEGSSRSFLSLQGGLDKVIMGGEKRGAGLGGAERERLLAQVVPQAPIATRKAGPAPAPGLVPAVLPMGHGHGAIRGRDMQQAMPSPQIQDSEGGFQRVGRKFPPSSE